MKALVIQHVAFEGPGHVAAFLESRGVSIDSILLGKDALPADPGAYDFLIVMGGPMSVHDEGEYAWLVPEKAFLRSWVQTGKPALGVCLGAQLFAEILGAKITKNGEREIGWFPVRWIEEARASEFAFHWHGETFSVPEAATRIAESDACANQGFRQGKVVALQFHLEATYETVSLMTEHGANDLLPAAWVQPKEAILAGARTHCGSANARLEKILIELLGLRSR